MNANLYTSSNPELEANKGGIAMDIEVVRNDVKSSTKYNNVTHVSVVGNWLYLTMSTGEWAKLDSRDVTIEISNPTAKAYVPDNITDLNDSGSSSSVSCS